MLEVADEVPGSRDLINWFGYWPSFHDAEVLEVELHRAGLSKIRIHTWETQRDRTDNQGCYLRTKHVMGSFLLEEVMDVHLEGFNHQNVITGLDLKQQGGDYNIGLEGIYGVDGSITARKVRIELQPGIP